jgi:hypothetical protein
VHLGTALSLQLDVLKVKVTSNKRCWPRATRITLAPHRYINDVFIAWQTVINHGSRREIETIFRVNDKCSGGHFGRCRARESAVYSSVELYHKNIKLV